MAIFGIGLHIIFAIFFAIHAIRNNQNTYWLFLLFMFPGLGSIVYFIAIYLPQSRIQSHARVLKNTAQKIIDPTKALRDAKSQFDYAPTAQNQVQYARALLDYGQYADAAMNFEACLSGIFAEDLDIRYGAAQAFYLAKNFSKANFHIEKIEAQSKDFRPEAIMILKARCLLALQNPEQGREILRDAYKKFGTFESLVENGIYACETDDFENAKLIDDQINRELNYMSKHAKAMQAPLLKRWNDAKQLATIGTQKT